jgi:hypothetical protein
MFQCWIPVRVINDMSATDQAMQFLSVSVTFFSCMKSHWFSAINRVLNSWQSYNTVIRFQTKLCIISRENLSKDYGGWDAKLASAAYEKVSMWYFSTWETLK